MKLALEQSEAGRPLSNLKRSIDPRAWTAIKTMISGILYPLPYGLRSAGGGSRILRPRRIQGARYIQIGHRTLILGHSWIGAIGSYAGLRHEPRLCIGSDVYIGQYSTIQCVSRIEIADGCVMSERVFITDFSHGFDPRAGLIMRQPLVHRGDVHLQEGTFVGYQACIMPGVTLGKHCVVAANSVVTRSFPDYTMIAGSPAVAVSRFDTEVGTWL
jgi:acetyltransferase-like isoleucine patch superfamily enzyme